MMNHIAMHTITLTPLSQGVSPPPQNKHPRTNTNRKSVLAGSEHILILIEEVLFQVSCGPMVNLADITVNLLGRVIHPYKNIY